jgi:hypothetical protein
MDNDRAPWVSWLAVLVFALVAGGIIVLYARHLNPPDTRPLVGGGIDAE